LAAWLDDELDEQRVVPGGSHYDQHIARYERAAERIPLGVRVLDAGTGTGYGAALVAEAGREVVAVDASRTALEFAAERFGSDVDFQLANVLDLPFPDSTFDAVTCFEVIEHVQESDQERLVSELARVLKPGGKLYLSTPHERMERLHERSIGATHWEYHVGPLAPRRLRALLRRRFRCVELYGQTPDLGGVHLALKAVDWIGLRLLLRPSWRRSVRRAMAAEPNGGGAFRFSRLVSRSAAITFAEAVK
jgi:SAM-dependent methyltransferase